jgi:hypothetical protein
MHKQMLLRIGTQGIPIDHINIRKKLFVFRHPWHFKKRTGHELDDRGVGVRVPVRSRSSVVVKEI